MLKAAAKEVIETNKNDFRKRDIADIQNSNTAYNNFQKLRYHGLIAHVTDSGVKQRDRWLITRNAWAFLRGEIELPKWVMIRNNHIDESFNRCDDTIGVKGVYRGSDAITTTFEYFDHDTGAQIGFRPVLPPKPAEQQTLIDIPPKTETRRYF